MLTLQKAELWGLLVSSKAAGTIKKSSSKEQMQQQVLSQIVKSQEGLIEIVKLHKPDVVVGSG